MFKSALPTKSEMEAGSVEYIIIGDTDKHKDCLVYTCGRDIKTAEKVLDRINNNPSEDDIYNMEMGLHNFRIKEVKSADCWWNDPFLAN